MARNQPPCCEHSHMYACAQAHAHIHKAHMHPHVQQTFTAACTHTPTYTRTHIHALTCTLTHSCTYALPHSLSHDHAPCTRTQTHTHAYTQQGLPGTLHPCISLALGPSDVHFPLHPSSSNPRPSACLSNTPIKVPPPGAWLEGKRVKILKSSEVPRDLINLLLETISLGNSLPH